MHTNADAPCLTISSFPTPFLGNPYLGLYLSASYTTVELIGSTVVVHEIVLKLFLPRYSFERKHAINSN